MLKTVRLRSLTMESFSKTALITLRRACVIHLLKKTRHFVSVFLPIFLLLSLRAFFFLLDLSTCQMSSFPSEARFFFPRPNGEFQLNTRSPRCLCGSEDDLNFLQ